jgi:mannose-1-phosphate guanylyltransferase
MFGVVFAAGLGTRLRPLTDRIPKPAAPLLNRPLASFSLERLAAAGVRRVGMNTHHLAEVVEREIRGHVPAGMSVSFARESSLLGTGGGLRNVVAMLDAGREQQRPRERRQQDEGQPDEVIVMNGDILFWPDLDAAIAKHRALGAVATVVLRGDPRARQLGALEVDAEGRVRRLLGLPIDASGTLRELMFTGVHVLSRRAFADLPAQGCIIRSSYRRWIDAGEVVAGIIDESPWRDLGTPADYLEASVGLLRGQLRWPSFEPPVARSLCAQGARIGDGAVLIDTVVGEGACVEPRVRLERCIVWPGAHVREDATDVVFAAHARIDARR